MADLSRAEALVQAMGRDPAFRAAVEAAPTAAAKRAVLDARGFADIELEDMKAYVERKGGKLAEPPGGRELSNEELAAVAGGWTAEELAFQEHLQQMQLAAEQGRIVLAEDGMGG